MSAREGWVSDNAAPEHPMDGRVALRADGDLEVTVQSFFTEDGPWHWTSASDQRMDAFARRLAPGAKVYLRGRYWQRGWIVRADGSQGEAARVAHYTAPAVNR